MRIFLLGLALIVSTASAQPGIPYKLVLTWSAGGVTVADYPSAARCAAAQRALEAEAERRKQRAQEQSERSGGMIVGGPWIVYGVCIPG